MQDQRESMFRLRLHFIERCANACSVAVGNCCVRVFASVASRHIRVAVHPLLEVSMVRRWALASGVLFSLLLLSASAFAQEGSIIGTAADDTKAVLPGVNVTATDQETGRVATAVTNEKGEYRLLRLLPGKYTVQAELSGFSSVILKDVELLVGNNLTIPFTMK